MNLFIIKGRLCEEPEYRQTQSGTSVAQFNFAVNRSYKKEGEADADFFRITVFGKKAEALAKCQVGKGTELLLQCEVRNNNYTDKKGNKVYGFQFVAFDFEFCGSKKSENTQPQEPAPAGRGYGTPRNEQSAYGAPQPSYQQQGLPPSDWQEYQSDEKLPF